MTFSFLPLWAFYGLGAAALSAAMMLLQERLRIEPRVLVFWNKAACAVAALPFALHHGLPSDPLFYFYLGLGAVMYAISDIVFFSGIVKSNAGAVARLLPSSVLISFILWFALHPRLLDHYLQAPLIAGLIGLTLCCFVYFSMRLKKCAVTMGVLRSVWFVIFAASVGPVLAKTVTLHAPQGQGPYAYIFCEALMMMTLWTIWQALRRPLPASAFFVRRNMLGGLTVGCVSVGIIFLNVSAYYHVDNPAYVPAIKLLDSVMIMGLYSIAGRKVQGDLKAGFGIVGCAIVLILLKSYV